MPEREDAFAANLYTVARQAAEAVYRRAEGDRDEQLHKPHPPTRLEEQGHSPTREAKRASRCGT